MPCRDEMAEAQDRKRDYQELAFLRAGLCAVLTVMEKNMKKKTFAQYIDCIDWKEAGVTKREFLGWWEDHKEKDRKRLAAMEKQLKEIKIRKEALAKLTDEEKKILGVK